VCGVVGVGAGVGGVVVAVVVSFDMGFVDRQMKMETG